MLFAKISLKKIHNGLYTLLAINNQQLMRVIIRKYKNRWDRQAHQKRVYKFAGLLLVPDEVALKFGYCDLTFAPLVNQYFQGIVRRVGKNII